MSKLELCWQSQNRKQTVPSALPKNNWKASTQVSIQLRCLLSVGLLISMIPISLAEEEEVYPYGNNCTLVYYCDELIADTCGGQDPLFIEQLKIAYKENKARMSKTSQMASLRPSTGGWFGSQITTELTRFFEQVEDESGRRGINKSGRHLLAVAGEYKVPSKDPGKLRKVGFRRFFQGPFFRGTLVPGGAVPFPSIDPRTRSPLLIQDLVYKAVIFEDGSYLGEANLKFELDRRANATLRCLDLLATRFAQIDRTELEKLLLEHKGGDRENMATLPPWIKNSLDVKPTDAGSTYLQLRTLVLEGEVLRDDYLTVLAMVKAHLRNYLDTSKAP